MKFLKIKRGLWIVFAFNLLVGLVVWWAAGDVLKVSIENPVMAEFVDSIPTIAIEDKTVVDPVNLNTVRTLGGTPLLYIQTDRDYVGVGVIHDGIYFTRKAISILNNGVLQSQLELPQTAVITSQKIHTFLHYVVVWVPVLLALLYFIRLWILYLILVGLTALIAAIPAIRKKLVPYTVWRSAACAYIAVLFFDFLAGYFGYGLPILTYQSASLPGWLGAVVLFFVTMLIQLAVTWIVSVVIMLITVMHGQKNKTKKEKKKA